VDRAYENEEDPNLKPDITLKIFYDEEMDELLENEDGNVNPFCVRELRFEYCSYGQPDLEDLEEYWGKVIQILERFGHHVHRISMEVEKSWRAFPFEGILVSILRATPNLRSLLIEGAYTGRRSLDRLRDYFQANLHQLPELSHLKYLSLGSSCVCWTGPLLSKLVADPRQLKYLSLDSEIGGDPLKK